MERLCWWMAADDLISIKQTKTTAIRFLSATHAASERAWCHSISGHAEWIESIIFWLLTLMQIISMALTTWLVILTCAVRQSRARRRMMPSTRDLRRR